MQMKKIRKQIIGDINNTNAIIINGDVSIDQQIFDNIQNLLIEILRKDFERFSADAINIAKGELNKLITSIFERLVKDQQEKLIEKFNNPSIQVFLHDTLIGYISNEDEIMKEFIIDILIDRLKIDNNSTEKAILSEAIKLIPNLNMSTSSLIALMNLRHYVVSTNHSFMLESFFRQLSPIIDISCNINKIDIEYIIENKCTKTISGIFPIDTYENHLLKQYDLYFRQIGTREELEKFSEIHPEIMHRVNNDGTSMFYYIDSEMNYWKFSDANCKLFYKRLRDRQQEYLIPLVEELKKTKPLFTEKQVREYLCNINQNWECACKLLNCLELKTLDLSILGSYIGSKIINKFTNTPSLSISSLSNPIAL